MVHSLADDAYGEALVDPLRQVEAAHAERRHPLARTAELAIEHLRVFLEDHALALP